MNRARYIFIFIFGFGFKKQHKNVTVWKFYIGVVVILSYKKDILLRMSIK